ncbi:autotransporter outer membrane beta-barrel domain-containing protein [Pseudomonas sp. UFMG81]|uniref:autotransporter outer membrane beta-barrel domain-containing protein n=1 Tax=Pseudomonas sp. UFMG81 TaxID=2745936 RepID=UPI00188FF27E|nr:autotransporter outer membrane beta-barrel domain-containing protein [Pseudomonas sp. UFMG81]
MVSEPIRPEEIVKRTLSLAGVITLLTICSGAALARDLVGEQLTIDASTPLDRYNLSAGSVLTMDNATTLSIVSTQSQLNILRGTTTTTTGNAIELLDSQATIANAAISTSANGIGLVLGRMTTGSSATVINSQISGGAVGAQASALGQLNIQGSQVSATGPTGTGVRLIGGTATISDGSVITGQASGIRMIRESATNNTPSLTLDGSRVVGVTGAAIDVGNDARSSIILRNGSSLDGGNGTAINLGRLSESTIQVTDSQLQGDIQLASQAKADLAVGNSTVQGSIRNAGTLTAALDQATLNGDLLTSGTSHVQLARSSMTGNIAVASPGSLDLAMEQSRLVGDIAVEAGATAQLNMNSGSQLRGTLTNVSQATIGTDSDWTMTADSNVGNLAMRGGQVTFGDPGSFHTLTVTNLSGNGTFVMDSDFVTGNGDQLIVTGTSEGNHGLLVGSSGQEASVESLRLVQTADGGAQFHLLNDRERVDVGAYSYELAQNGNDWVLNRETRTVAPITMAAMALFNTPITVAYGELSSLRSRMGELRYSEGRNAGVWMRAYGNQYNVSGASQGVGYQQNQRGLSLGADMQLSDSDWLVGLLAGSSRSDLNLDYGTSGTVDSYYVGGYATWLDRETGFYVDTVLKYNRYQNNAKVGMSDHTRSKGDYDTHGVSASVEAGKHIKLNDGYFIEPFVQVATAAVAGKDYTFDNGLRAEGDMAKSLLGKVGTTVGKTIPLDGGAMVQPYVKGAFAHEFAQRNQVQVNNNVFNNDLSGSRAELGAGVSLALSRQFRVHADVEYSNGKSIEQPYGVNVGVRYDF